MATFLEICQDVARESGTVSGVRPTTVIGQSGRELKIVNHVRSAWTRIQNMHSTWMWMRDEFQKDLSVSAQRYTPAAIGLSRHARWITEPDSVTLYATATGVSDESAIGFIPWPVYRRRYERGARVADRPVEYSVSPAQELCFQLMNAAFTVRGEYMKSAQILAADEEIPECPAHHHETIKYFALVLLTTTDEAAWHTSQFYAQFGMALSNLEDEQLPTPTIGATPIGARYSVESFFNI